MSTLLAAGCLLKLRNCHFENVSIHSRRLKTSLSSSCCSKSVKSHKRAFNTPHPPKDPPESYKSSSVDHDAFDVPDFIPATVFRQFTSRSEKLGPDADKRNVYKNPEYYSYYRYSFVALQLASLEMRVRDGKKAKGGDKRCLYEKEDNENDVEKYSSDEDNNK